MIAQNQFRAADTEFRLLGASQPRRHGGHLVEEGGDVSKEQFARRRQAEGRPLKEFYPELVLQLSDLRAHRGLLNAVRNIAHRRADPTVFRHVIEEFEEVDVHLASIKACLPWARNGSVAEGRRLFKKSIPEPEVYQITPQPRCGYDGGVLIKFRFNSISDMHTFVKIVTVLIEVMATAALADFVSGFIHWIEDAYFEETTPVIGPLFIRPNIVHHHAPRYFTKLTWWESSKDLLLAGVALLVGAWTMNLLTWQVWLFVALGVNANQVHKWSHRSRSENGKIISWLQDWHILQTPRHHGLHHSDPKNTYYCPITNLVNPVLEKVSFWDRLEGVIAYFTGVEHRKDTAVRGQGPGPEWLVECRPASRAVKAVTSTATATTTLGRCVHDCSTCPAKCGRQLKAA